MLKQLTYFSMNHPKLVIALTLVITGLFLFQFPKAHIDTDPENMLEAHQADRVFYNQIKKDFGIRDMIVLGITDEAGIFQPQTLGKIARITDEILRIEGIIVEDDCQRDAGGDRKVYDGRKIGGVHIWIKLHQ